MIHRCFALHDQNRAGDFHVRHRLQRYRAGQCMTYDDAVPEKLADALAELMNANVDYANVETNAAARTAELIAAAFVCGR